MFHDPSGLIIEIRGTEEHKHDIMRYLRQLTRDHLYVEVLGEGHWRVRHQARSLAMARQVIRIDNARTAGTNMIRQLLTNGRHTTTMRIGYSMSGLTNIFSPDSQRGASTPGLGGGSGGTVYFDPNRAEYVYTEDWNGGNRRKEPVPNQIVLGHELIHALRSVNGNMRTDRNLRPEYVYRTATAQDRTLRREEAETIGLDHYRMIDGVRTRINASTWDTTENSLRREQGILRRRVEW